KPLSVKRGNLGALKHRPPAGRIVVLDPGSGRTEEPVSGCEPVALAIGVAPTCPPGSAMSSARVDHQLSIHGVRDLTLEGAQSFPWWTCPRPPCDRSTSVLRSGDGSGRWQSCGSRG